MAMRSQLSWGVSPQHRLLVMSNRLPRLPLQAEYHDGQLEAVEFGERRDVILTVRLDPVWNDGQSPSRRVRFSAIENYDEVRAFFATMPERARADASLDEVVALVKPAKGRIGIDLAKLGYIELRGAKVREL